ncbi:ABC transporter permease [Bacteroidales bacterium OttesenSCG-928-A17]|nr:ABC transporter permease [Bacteroidales bacterium OttesenSCG-928-A17]
MLIHYIKVAIRNLWKYKIQSLISVLGLSVALACFAICFYVVRSIITIDSSYPDSDRMYVVREDDRVACMPLMGKLVKDAYPDVEDYLTVEFHDNYLFDIGGGDTVKQYHLSFLETNPSFVNFFSYPVVSPLLPNYKEQQNGIILFESTTQKVFGRTDVTGEKMIAYRGIWEGNEHVEKGFSYTVLGVVKDLPPISFLSIRGASKEQRAGIFINDEHGNLNPDARTGWTASISLVKLKKNVSVDAFNTKFNSFLPIVENPNFAGMIGMSDGKKCEYSLMPYSESLKKFWSTLYYIVIGLFLTIGILVLSVAVVNYISYAIHQFLLKKHECAIRKSVNANWWQLYFLFYTEIALTILLSGVFAYIWLSLFAPEYINLFKLFTIEQPVLLQQLLQYIVLGIIISFLCCIIPVMRIEKRSVRETLFGGKSVNPKSKLRDILLGFQLFISILFISASVFVYLQMKYVRDVTYSSLSQQEKDNIVEIKMIYQDLFKPHKEEIINRLKSNPNIENVLLTGSEIADIGATMTQIKYEGETLARDSVAILYVGNNYCDFTKTKLLEGHFLEEDRTDQIVINETAKRILGKDAILGETIQTWRRQYTVVGVVADEIRLGPTSSMKATFYFPNEEINIIYAKINPVKYKETVIFIDELIREFVPPTLEFEMNTLSSTIRSFSEFEQILFKIILAMSVISIIISLSGVYSSVYLNTEYRRREVAIRKINGAAIRDILKLFLKSYLWALLIAAIPAFVIAYYVIQSWLEVYAFHIAFPWWVFPLVLLLVAVLLILTVITRLLIIAKENPAETLKMS